jgi:hypothetical protein
MDSAPTPLAFADRLIRMSVDNSAGADMIILPQDYMALRVTFRKMGGSWEKLGNGDIRHCRLLSEVVRAWSSLPERKREVATS